MAHPAAEEVGEDPDHLLHRPQRHRHPRHARLLAGSGGLPPDPRRAGHPARQGGGLRRPLQEDGEGQAAGRDDARAPGAGAPQPARRGHRPAGGRDQAQPLLHARHRHAGHRRLRRPFQAAQPELGEDPRLQRRGAEDEAPHRVRAPGGPRLYRGAAAKGADGGFHRLLREPVPHEGRRLAVAGVDGGPLRGGRPHLHLRPRPHRAEGRGGGAPPPHPRADGAGRGGSGRAARSVPGRRRHLARLLPRLPHHARAAGSAGRPVHGRLVRPRRAGRGRNRAPRRGGPRRRGEGGPGPPVDGLLSRPGGRAPAGPRHAHAGAVPGSRVQRRDARRPRSRPRSAEGPPGQRQLLDDGDPPGGAGSPAGRPHVPQRHSVAHLRAARPRAGRGAGPAGRPGRRQRVAVPLLAGGPQGGRARQPRQRRVPGQ